MGSVYDDVYARSMRDRESFWAAAADEIYWERRWDKVFDDARPPFYRWFSGAQLNTCYNALDLQIDRGRGKQRALIYDSPVTGTLRAYTYGELRDEVARFAGALRRQGIERGDRVIVYMPMVPEAVIAMLACARIGAIHSVVFGGFASKELATRIDDARPKLIVSASCGIEVNRVVPYKPWTRRSTSPGASRIAASSCSARKKGRLSSAGAISTGTTRSAPRPRSTACPLPPRTPCTSSTRPARPASRRVSCATTAATPSRSSGA
jgi:propionyl-CoA synthetase